MSAADDWPGHTPESIRQANGIGLASPSSGDGVQACCPELNATPDVTAPQNERHGADAG